MKATIYIFGNFAAGYSQYPDNYTRDLFESIAKSRKGVSELIYHRDASLTYYIYTRELSNSAKSFIGLCYVFNGILITDFTYLFDIFEDAITNIVVKGELLEFTDDGDLTTRISQLYTNTQELQRISDYLNNKLSSLGRYAEKLPPPNYAISNTEWKTYTFDEIAIAQDVINDYSNIRVLKGENYDTDSLKGYSHKLKTKNDTIKKLTNEIFNQKEEIAKLTRQKKQIKWVVMLLMLIMIGGLCFYFYAQEKTQVIQNKSSEINNLHDEVQDKNQKIRTLKSDSLLLTNQLHEAKRIIDNMHDELENIPLYIYFDSWTSTNYKQPNSTSQIIYSFYANADDELEIPYFVSSEDKYDFLKITLKGSDFSEQQLLKKSGVKSGTCNYVFPTSDSYQLVVSYTKDASNDYNNDKAGVSQFKIYRSVVNRLRVLSEY